MLLPAFLCAVTSTQVISLLRTFLEQSQATEVDFLGMSAPIEFDFINLFGLADVRTILINLDDQRWSVALLIILVNLIGGGLVVALTIMLVGWSYNLLAALTGGLEVELKE